MVSQNSKIIGRSISAKLLSGVLLISSFLTVFTTSIQVFYDYKSDIEELKSSFNQIESSYISPLSLSLWTYNDEQVMLILEGIIDIKDIVYVSIVENGNMTFYKGLKPNAESTVRTYELSYKEGEVVNKIGVVNIHASLERINNRIIDKFIFIMVNQSIKTFFASFLILIFVGFLVTRYLRQMVSFFEGYNPKDQSNRKLILKNKSNEKKDEIDILAISINTMIDGLDDLHRNLELKIKERTKELNQKKDDIQNILCNLQQGIFTIVEGNIIDHEYSLYLEKILNTSNIAGKDAIFLLFENSNLSADKINQIEYSLVSIIGESDISFKLNCHLLPTEMSKFFSASETKILELSWQPIKEDHIIKKMIVSIRDVTELRYLQEKSDKQKQDIEIIKTIIDIGLDKFIQFCENSCFNLDECIALIKNYDLKSKDKILRILHTLKGESRLYGISNISNLVHKLEEKFRSIDSKKIVINRENYEQKLKDLKVKIEYCRSICTTKIATAKPSPVYSEIPEDIMMSNLNAPANVLKLQNYFWDNFISFNLSDIGTICKPIITGINSIARGLGKDDVFVAISDNDKILIKNTFCKTISDVLIHLFRNSIDHGIELPHQRRMVNKPKNGTIFINFFAKEKSAVLEFFDDGKGLDLNLIKRKGRAIGINLDNYSQQELAELIFVSGLSTKSAVTDISGLGVGMDAIKSFLEENSCTIRIVSIGKEEEPSYPFKLVVEIPDKFVLFSHEPNLSEIKVV